MSERASTLDAQLERLIEQTFVRRFPKIPVAVPRFDSTSLPDATAWTTGLIFSPDDGQFRGSDGATWLTISGGGGGGGTVTQVNTGAGLTGGPINVTGTVSFATVADQRILANVSGVVAVPTATAPASILGIGSALKWVTARTVTLGTDLTGNVSLDGSADGTLNATIANDAVTYGKMQNVSAASRLLGRGSAGGAGDVEEITLGAGLTMTGTSLSASGGGGGLAGVAVVDFGAGATDASVAVVDAGVVAGSAILATVMAKDSADHTADEHLVEDIHVRAGGITAGVGFNVYARTGNVALTGTWNVAYQRAA